MLRELPKLTHAAASGQVSSEHLQHVARLVDQVGPAAATAVEPTLADAAGQLDADQFATVCARVRAHVDPDGTDPAAGFETRGLTMAPVAGMMTVRGQLDPEGGAALATALDSLMCPPCDGDDRSPAQRRADALVELARRPLAAGGLPAVGAQRPQVGVLLYPQALSPQTLAALAQAQGEALTAKRLRDFISDTPVWGDTAEPGRNTRADRTTAAQTCPPRAFPTGGDDAEKRSTQAGAPGRFGHPDGSPELGSTTGRPSWTRPGWADPPWLNWLGPVAPEVAQRIACDADVFRLILDPATSMPLDVGRTHRLVPHWIRRALYARDRGCRWTGCTTPAEWTDAHHLDPWADHGQTSADRCLLLCRHHHALVHEGGWSIDLDLDTGEVNITRPGGFPYHIPRRSMGWTGPSTIAG
jgi:hypothetical protein